MKHDRAWINQMLTSTWCLIGWFISCCSAVPLAIALPTPEVVPVPLSLAQLQQATQAITVKVLAGREGWGSGILLRRQGTVYTVLTNDHVLGTATTYRIQTADRQLHTAERLRDATSQDDDLALLQFRSFNDYRLATIGRSASVAVGDRVFAVGFPYVPDAAIDPGYRFTVGQITFVAEKPLNGGYQLGYSNAVVKGMSGGALLNQQGQVIGINGMHAYPLWGGYTNADGSQPALPVELMVRSSWAIPSDRVTYWSSRSAIPFVPTWTQAPPQLPSSWLW